MRFRFISRLFVIIASIFVSGTAYSEDVSKKLQELFGGSGDIGNMMENAKQCAHSKDPETKIRTCSAVLKNPFMMGAGKVEGHILRGSAYLQLKKYKPAMQDADTALSLGHFKGEANFLKAAVLVATSQYAQSIKYFSEALSTPPKGVTRDVVLRSRGLAKRKAGFYKEALSDFEEALKFNPSDVESYFNRGLTYSALFQYDKAMTDFNKALRFRPDAPEVLIARADVYAATYQFKRALFDYKKVSNGKIDRPEAESLKALSHIGRGMVYVAEGVNRQAVQNADIALKKVDNFAPAYLVKSYAYANQRKFRMALEEANKAIADKDMAAYGYQYRGYAYLKSENFDNAIKDFSSAINRKPNLLWSYIFRGEAYLAQEKPEQALADINKAVSLYSREPYAHLLKGVLLEAQGNKQAALISYNKGINTPRQGVLHDELYKEALAGVKRLKQYSQPIEVSSTKPAKKKVVPVQKAYGKRVALVIGNGRYENASLLQNTHNDAKAMATKLRALGFAEVIELYDLDYGKLRKALKSFGDKTVNADWAVIYYAGHGIQVDGKNFIIPVDATLRRASHIEDEAVSLNRVLSKVEDAKKLRMVILDACRNNPFASRMFRSAGSRTRSLGKGLAPIEPDRGTLVAYSARDGQVAFDGEGQNSPYTKALLQHMDESGLEINLLFRKVRDTVLRNTGRQQEPYVYGSLPGIELFFRH